MSFEQATPTYHEGPRSWLADQLLEPTKLIFAVVIAESLNEYRAVVVSPFHHDHFMATIALIGIYLTTIWSWFGWHGAQLTYPYIVRRADGTPNTWEVMRFYADIGIVVAYAYTLFQVEPIVDAPGHNLFWFLMGYPLIIVLYGTENLCRRQEYGKGVRRTRPLATTLLIYTSLIVTYYLLRRAIEPAAVNAMALLWLNGLTLGACIVVMWVYRHFLNPRYKAQIARTG